MRELKTIQIDTEKGVCRVNGEDVSAEAHKLRLAFEGGRWSLTISMDKYYESPVIGKVTTGETLK